MRCCFCVDELVSESNDGGDANARHTDKLRCAILATCEEYQVLLPCC
jgi:hypothetical protein